ncbi:polyprenol phosphomannose-dependent alpha 1,6 mannosyltransferase MptB [Herbiconiux sp. 11R-BC]|uniref:polyprenol phosphomannose-dependent alpha 1,6 mannosyltransferase MptB n=1 Tax=Herbiconiux sp. 11R-BC TaxID=3111637 RepID=UPI003C2F329F
MALGFLGSLAITAGSLGAGWLPSAMRLAARPEIIALRDTRGAVAACALLVVGGVLVLLFCWLSLGLSLGLPRRLSRRAADQGSASPGTGDLRQVVASLVAWSLPLLVAVPLFSRDIYAYIGQGRLMDAGLDPYANVMADVPGWAEAGVDVKWSTTVTPYGPLFVMLQRAIVGLTASAPLEFTLVLTRLLSVAGLALLIYSAWRIAQLRGFDQAAVLWAVGVSPLVLMNFVVAGHNDSLMLGLVVAGAYQGLKGRPVLATVLVTAAIGVKPIALVALPVIGLIWAGADAGWGRVIARWAAVAGIAAGGMLALGAGLGVGLGWVAGLGTPLGIGSWYSVPRFTSLWLRDLVNALGGDGEAWRSGVVLVFLVAGCLLAVVLYTVKRRSDPLWLLAGGFAAVALFSPLLHPWYGLWLLCLFAVAGLRRAWQLRVLIYGTVFLMVIGTGEGLDLVPRLVLDPLILIPSRGTAIVGAVVLVAVFEFTLWRRFTARGLPMPMLAGPPLPPRRPRRSGVAWGGVSASSTPSP